MPPEKLTPEERAGLEAILALANCPHTSSAKAACAACVRESVLRAQREAVREALETVDTALSAAVRLCIPVEEVLRRVRDMKRAPPAPSTKEDGDGL